MILETINQTFCVFMHSTDCSHYYNTNKLLIQVAKLPIRLLMCVMFCVHAVVNLAGNCRSIMSCRPTQLTTKAVEMVAPATVSVIYTVQHTIHRRYENNINTFMD